MVERNKRFVFGKFHWPAERLSPPPLPKPQFALPPALAKLDARDQVAIEVLREYGANELIGKLYFKGAFNQWTPVEPSKVEDIDWFKWYKRVPQPARALAKIYNFEMDGSGNWAVLHFRNESDETGPYVAVALRYVG